jgi:hypothetical protein
MTSSSELQISLTKPQTSLSELLTSLNEVY